jgi:hypothetical protein
MRKALEVRRRHAPQPDRTPQLEHLPRASSHTASLVSTIGPTSRPCPEGTDRCDHATAVPSGIAEDRLPGEAVLVALLRIFGQEPHGDGRQRFWDCAAINRRDRLTRDVAMNPPQRVPGDIHGNKREHGLKHLV